MIAGDDEDGGEVEISSGEYCSLSECIVTPDSAIGLDGSSEAMVLLLSLGGLAVTKRGVVHTPRALELGSVAESHRKGSASSRTKVQVVGKREAGTITRLGVNCKAQ